MTTYTVTTANYNSAAFWSSISVSSSGHVLDFTGLPSSFFVSVQPDNNLIWIWNGSAWSSIGEAGSGSNFNLGAPTELHYFTELRVGNSTAELLGSSANETLVSGAGNDTIEGGSGNDSIQSGGGNDSIDAGVGNDTINAGSGNDYVESGQGNDRVETGTGNDIVAVSDDHNNDTITDSGGGSDYDAIVFSTPVGTDGVDIAFISGTTATYDYQTTLTNTFGTFTGFEQIITTNYADTVDTTASTGFQQVFLGGGNDTLTLGSVGSEGYGQAGDDQLTGGSGSDRLDGGIGNDTIFGGIGQDTLVGDDGDDLIDGGAGNDSIIGGAGADTLAGGDGDDYIEGGAGNDFLTTGLGQDTLMGGDGNDTLMNSDGDDSLDGGAGDDSIVATGGMDTLRGGTGADYMDGGDDADTFIIEDSFGNDTIIGGEGLTDGTDVDSDTIDGGTLSGDVTVSFTGDEAGTITDGIDTITFFEIENVFSGNGDDVLDASSDSVGVGLFGGAGSDTITGGTGADYIDGGDDQDTLILRDGFGTDTIIGGEGGVDFDTIDLTALTVPVTVTYTSSEAGTISDGTNTITFSQIEHLVLTDHNDTVDAVTNWAGAVYVDGGGGNDSIDGGVGLGAGDTLIGGAGNDTLRGWDGDDTLIGGDGNDVLMGDQGADSLDGGAGDDQLSSYGGAATLSGGDGSDLFSIFDSAVAFGGTPGIDGVVIDGGDGGTDQDLVSLASFATGATVTFTGDEDGTIAAGGQTAGFSNIEAFYGSNSADFFDASATYSGLVGDAPGVTIYSLSGNDTVLGGRGGDTIDGGAGLDSIRGGAGNDSIDGGDDNDKLYGEAGSDTLQGGAGNDTLDGGADNDYIVGGDGNDYIASSNTNSGDDIIDGGLGDDIIYTGSGNDWVDGGDGRDTIYLAGGENTVFGGAGNDRITTSGVGGASSIDGGTGDDTISTYNGANNADTVEGGDGNDLISTFDGDDLVSGGDGNDTVEAGAGDDTITGGTGNDRLTGGGGDDIFHYTAGDGADTITDFNSGNSGALNDSDTTNNDFIDLSAFYDDIWELHADQADDGILNQSNEGVDGADYSDNDSFGSGSLTFSGASADNSSFTSENTGVVCFASGTAIRTPVGEVLVETLRTGDLVMTHDHGPSKVLWIGCTEVVLQAGQVDPSRTPVRIKPDVASGERALLVSPQHCLLMMDAAGQPVLARARHLAEETRLAAFARGRSAVTYWHVLLERHSVLISQGRASESFYPGPNGLVMMEAPERARLLGALPALRTAPVETAYGPLALKVLDRSEVRSSAQTGAFAFASTHEGVIALPTEHRRQFVV
ncbi:Hint domain-containing protein [Sulfitobacter guttiformis]|uniref:Ca2+-binding RTX toxin-like protein n=1 Tax=Sulfitobacter guttiformis TaxID=74349 RepID=A0A420DUS5_9RHOB|nr:Hint domain-containing protein [Sulfitobacter guttiformis]KIN71487.1 Hemolysin-type calcium-binding protein [Sulfitobacter guttiformis KCTC 32187]RKE97920.1 Ca2+-binding RTX toxin-like protein [Sulfitobacter guttiformis]